MARVMIHVKSLPLHFWAEAVNTACHIHNKITIRSGTTITLYELWKGRKLNVKYLHVFGTCYTLADREYHRKWDVKSEKRIFLGYSQNSRAYRVFNNKTIVVMETINVVVNDYEQTYKQTDDDDELVPKVTMVLEIVVVDVPIADTRVNNFEDDSKLTQKEVITEESELIPYSHVRKNHPSSSIIGDPLAGVTTRKKDKIDYTKMIANIFYTSSIKPTLVNEALKMNSRYMRCKKNYYSSNETMCWHWFLNQRKQIL
ncbi:gag-pol polyprotein [Cucumis melo var. makuwa]|uniref:Gag-pol polyprotein n=1 Tax=Cucumis melo var. makuwa TaxID=1194695 RepID=A0A5D3DMH8_CUCMM|nr:gag-pol polyprotein [Cucumis melo var. makuwa]TYK24811.1 gag-pol polyprotein [Cucumis melo var. makuwa]